MLNLQTTVMLTNAQHYVCHIHLMQLEALINEGAGKIFDEFYVIVACKIKDQMCCSVGRIMVANTEKSIKIIDDFMRFYRYQI